MFSPGEQFAFPPEYMLDFNGDTINLLTDYCSRDLLNNHSVIGCHFLARIRLIPYEGAQKKNYYYGYTNYI